MVELATVEAFFQTYDNLEHLAMMERVLGPLPAAGPWGGKKVRYAVPAQLPAPLRQRGGSNSTGRTVRGA